MSETSMDARVCSRCGETAGESRFCDGCGLNLAAQPELPTRSQWEAAHLGTHNLWSQPSTPPPDAASVMALSAPMVSASLAAPALVGVGALPAATPVAQPLTGRLTTVWWWVAAGFSLVSIALVIFCIEGISWISNVTDFLQDGGLLNALGARSARHGSDDALIFYWIAYALTAIGVLIWFNRAYKALASAGANLRFSSGWAVGSWFIPIFNLVRPKQIANDLWRASAALQDGTFPPDGSSLAERPVSSLVHWWWGLYLAGGLIFGVGMALCESNGSTGESLQHVLRLERTGFWIAILGAIVLIVGAILAIRFTWLVSQAHDRRRASAPVL